MSYHLLIHREHFTDTTTAGQLYINGTPFCYSLEDKKRGYGEKVMGATCIPDGTYDVDVTMSSRFKRMMPIIYNQSNGYELKANGISFKGIRLHGGNTHLNSEGCPLVAFKRLNVETIQQSAEKALTAKLIELGSKGFITVVSGI